jgi:hypothetical protein
VLFFFLAYYPRILVFQKDSYPYKGKKRGCLVQNHLKKWFGRVSPHLCLLAPVSRVSWTNVSNLAKSVWICLGMFVNLAPSGNWKKKLIASLAAAQMGVGGGGKRPFGWGGRRGGERWGEQHTDSNVDDDNSRLSCSCWPLGAGDGCSWGPGLGDPNELQEDL